MGGSSAERASSANPGLNQLQANTTAMSDPRIQNLLAGVGNGSVSVADALKQAGGLGTQQIYSDSSGNPTTSSTSQKKVSSPVQSYLGPNGMYTAGLNFANPTETSETVNNNAMGTANLSQLALSALATDPLAGSKIAQYEVMQDPTQAALYGSSGLLGQAENNYGTYTGNLAGDREALMGRDQSYGLTDQDLAAYGQAAGNITRQYGAFGNNLAQNLAQRGLGSANSGIANQSFSNLFGNQNEMLQNAQLQIAQNRINTAQQLAQARTSADLAAQSNAGNLAGSLGSQYQGAIQNQFGRQIAGAENQYNTLAGASGQAMNNQNLQQNVNNALWTQQQESSFNPLSIVTGGLSAGLGSAAGTLGSNLANGMTSNGSSKNNGFSLTNM